jgi:hypothetical protein
VDRQEPAAKVLWRIEEPPVARDPAQLAATLRQLARLDPVELGQQAVLERIVQAAATCCGSTGGVGLLLLNPDQQLCYVAAAGRPRREQELARYEAQMDADRQAQREPDDDAAVAARRQVLPDGAV